MMHRHWSMQLLECIILALSVTGLTQRHDKARQPGDPNFVTDFHLSQRLEASTAATTVLT